MVTVSRKQHTVYYSTRALSKNYFSLTILQLYFLLITALNADDKKTVENIVDGQKQWQKVIIEAMKMQRAKHYKQSLNLQHRPVIEDDDSQNVDVQVCHLFLDQI